jgi:hypothetical protein
MGGGGASAGLAHTVRRTSSTTATTLLRSSMRRCAVRSSGAEKSSIGTTAVPVGGCSRYASETSDQPWPAATSVRTPLMLRAVRTWDAGMPAPSSAPEIDAQTSRTSAGSSVT